jgi:hypothetical protein
MDTVTCELQRNSKPLKHEDGEREREEALEILCRVAAVVNNYRYASILVPTWTPSSGVLLVRMCEFLEKSLPHRKHPLSPLQRPTG